jgi:hypothetical protein
VAKVPGSDRTNTKKIKKGRLARSLPGSLHPRPSPRSCACVAPPCFARLAEARRLSTLQCKSFQACLGRFSKKNRKKGTCLHTPHLYIKKKRQTTLFVSRRRRAAVRFRRRISLPRHVFVDFSSATVCYYCVHIASFLHDFDRFTYSLSTASC